MSNLGEDFYPKLVQLSSEVGMKPEDILAIMVSESGINPQAQNPNGKATGLIQFMPGVLKGVGFNGTADDFKILNGEQQLPYIKNLIRSNMKLNGGPFTSAAQYYISVFWPVGLKLPGVRHGDPSTPIVEEHPDTVQDPKTHKKYSKKYYDLGIKISPSYEASAYRSNPLFHGSTQGAITYGDMMNQVEKNKRNPLYRKALLAMNQKTGYKPENMVANKTVPANVSSSFDKVLDEIAQSFAIAASTDNKNKKLYRKLLPQHNILIQISGSDYVNTVEFSRILCAALDEELKAFAYPHTDGSKIEIECTIHGPSVNCLQTVEAISNSVSKVFKRATQKIGGIEILTKCIIDKKSSYQQISLQSADTNYRTFLLKFA